MDIEYIEIFKRDISKYNLKDPDIHRKFEHSIRVMQKAGNLAIQKGLSREDISLVSLAGLLHDYGRFAQHKQTGSYEDSNGVDHGDLGIDLLFHQKRLSMYTVNLDDYDEIYDAVKYHNKYRLPAFMSTHNELICKVIRDADKMDLLYMANVGDQNFHEVEEAITDKVKESFQAERSISNDDIRNDNDKIIKFLAFVYGLEYKESFQYLKENSIIENFYNRIQKKEIFKEYFNLIQKYIEKKVK